MMDKISEKQSSVETLQQKFDINVQDLMAYIMSHRSHLIRQPPMSKREIMGGNSNVSVKNIIHFCIQNKEVILDNILENLNKKLGMEGTAKVDNEDFNHAKEDDNIFFEILINYLWGEKKINDKSKGELKSYYVNDYIPRQVQKHFEKVMDRGLTGSKKRSLRGAGREKRGEESDKDIDFVGEIGKEVKTPGQSIIMKNFLAQKGSERVVGNMLKFLENNGIEITCDIIENFNLNIVDQIFEEYYQNTEIDVFKEVLLQSLLIEEINKSGNLDIIYMVDKHNVNSVLYLLENVKIEGMKKIGIQNFIDIDTSVIHELCNLVNTDGEILSIEGILTFGPENTKKIFQYFEEEQVRLIVKSGITFQEFVCLNNSVVYQKENTEGTRLKALNKYIKGFKYPVSTLENMLESKTLPEKKTILGRIKSIL